MVLSISSRKSTVSATVIHKPPNMPVKTRRKSLAPRISPYSVAPQFGHRMKNIITGTSSMVGPSGPKPMGWTWMPAFVAAACVAWKAWVPTPLLPKSLCASRLNELMKLACELNSSSSTITAKPVSPP